jgi:hypothetical protein
MEELSHFFESMSYFPVERRNHGNLYLIPIKNTTSKVMGFSLYPACEERTDPDAV